MSTSHYVVEVETTAAVDEALADAWVSELAPWHGVVTERAGHLVAVVTLPGDNLAQATASALAVVGRLGEPLVVLAQPEGVRDARQGWDPVPELLSVTQAAERLCVSRQRVLQMISEGKLPSHQVGTTYVIPAAAVNEREPSR
ncbi:MAG: excisionase family DNA-binding protein [Micrococcales bacterium]|nr:excisionase family DNA-binding protein [Micrococcales bacterium]